MIEAGIAGAMFLGGLGGLIALAVHLVRKDRRLRKRRNAE
jgi:hypothetical protein